ncbi:MAG: hypothetical protein K2L42_03305 [Clostridia bacterium]|nr:hypothetical protein [Clostridia bacterium]
MTKLKKAFLALLAAALLIFICTGAVLHVSADTASETVTGEEQTVAPDISGEYDDLKAVAEGFLQYLKDKYGEDYEFYYNQIIDKWGSVEAYLLSLGEKLPEEYKSGWDKFVLWLGEYSVIWAPALAVALVVLAAVIGKKQFNKIFDKVVNAKLEPLIKELNLQSNATAALMRAQRAFLGNNKTLLENNGGLSDAVKELESAEEGLTK